MQTYGEYRPAESDAKGLALDDQQAWLVVPVGRNRDSGPFGESNFETALTMLGGESETVEVHRFRHWGCGWLEIIIVAPDSPAAAIAEEIEASLEGYPVLDDDDFSTREHGAYLECWQSWGAREFRRELVKKFDLDDDQDAALDAADDDKLLEFFESLIPSGEFHGGERNPRIRGAIEACTRADLDKLLTKGE